MIRKSRNTDEMLNDGLMQYGEETITRDSRKVITGKVFAARGSMYFKFMEIRDRDLDIYQGRTQAQTRKIKTYYVPDVDKSLKVQIADVTYDITSTDDDGTYRYWYLARVEA